MVAASAHAATAAGDMLPSITDLDMLPLAPSRAGGRVSRNPPVIDRDELVAVLPRLHRYARVLTGDRTRADDLVQDAVERALERESTFRSGGKLRPWLFSLIHTLFIDGVRPRDALDCTPDSN